MNFFWEGVGTGIGQIYDIGTWPRLYGATLEVDGVPGLGCDAAAKNRIKEMNVNIYTKYHMKASLKRQHKIKH